MAAITTRVVGDGSALIPCVGRGGGARFSLQKQAQFDIPPSRECVHLPRVDQDFDLSFGLRKWRSILPLGALPHHPSGLGVRGLTNHVVIDFPAAEFGQYLLRAGERVLDPRERDQPPGVPGEEPFDAQHFVGREPSALGRMPKVRAVQIDRPQSGGHDPALVPFGAVVGDFLGAVSMRA